MKRGWRKQKMRKKERAEREERINVVLPPSMHHVHLPFPRSSSSSCLLVLRHGISILPERSFPPHAAVHYFSSTCVLPGLIQGRINLFTHSMKRNVRPLLLGTYHTVQTPTLPRKTCSALSQEARDVWRLQCKSRLSKTAAMKTARGNTDPRLDSYKVIARK